MKKILMLGTFVLIAIVCCIGAAIRCSAGKTHTVATIDKETEEA